MPEPLYICPECREPVNTDHNLGHTHDGKIFWAEPFIPLAECEERDKITKEIEEWLEIALEAAGWQTVFDIPNWKEIDTRLKADRGEQSP